MMSFFNFSANKKVDFKQRMNSVFSFQQTCQSRFVHLTCEYALRTDKFDELENETSDLKIELLTDDDDLVEEEQQLVATNASSNIYPIEAMICAAEC